MPIYKILNDLYETINTIVASEDFMAANYTNYELVPEVELDPEPVTPIFYIGNVSVLDDSSPISTTIAGDFVAEKGSKITINCQIVDGEGNLMTTIDYTGHNLRIPVVRQADGVPTVDEIYFNVTVEAGVVIATGTLDRSGDWALFAERLNKSLERISAGWILKGDPISVLV